MIDQKDVSSKINQLTNKLGFHFDHNKQIDLFPGHRICFHKNPNFDCREMEGESGNLDQELRIEESPVKRKSNLIQAEEGEEEGRMKQQKLEENGKLNLSAKDKGKGKMVAEEEIRVSGDLNDNGRSELNDDDDDDDGDSDLSEDNYAKMDLDNILPARTRRRAAVEPEAYPVEGDDDDEDDDDDDEDDDDEDDDDVVEDDVDVYDNDVDDDEEEEVVDEEEEEEESK